MSLGRTTRERTPTRLVRGWFELALIAVLYVGYSASRLLASDAEAPARARALDLLNLERSWGLDVEKALNGWFVDVPGLGVASSFWYATTHYVVTLVVLVWIYRRSPRQYLTGRRVIVLASLLGLVCYLLLPTAPPRFVDDFTDVLALHSDAGWWGADASAPRGFGQMTNELAAFPSLHAGWALWVAIVVQRAGVAPWVRTLGWVYAAVMGIVVIGTGNHWTLDVLGGWLLVLVALGVVDAWEAVRRASGRDVDAADGSEADDDLTSIDG